LFPRARLVPDLSGDDQPLDVAAGRAVREALSMFRSTRTEIIEGTPLSRLRERGASAGEPGEGCAKQTPPSPALATLGHPLPLCGRGDNPWHVLHSTVSVQRALL